VVNDDMEIVHLRGKTGPYLELAAGHPTFSLSRMAREGLLVDLRAALARARKENVSVRKEGVQVQSNGQTRVVNLEVTPLRGHLREIVITSSSFKMFYRRKPDAGRKRKMRSKPGAAPPGKTPS
jgi:hypothetical protein